LDDEGREGQVEVEAEAVEVDSAEVGQANAHEALASLDKSRWGTDNLPVEAGAVLSGQAAEHDQERLALAEGSLLGGHEVGLPGEVAREEGGGKGQEQGRN
tara:strand:- start:48 stop:350 length:303 start_codon:yes stop_codon:yes gene_type:complete